MSTKFESVKYKQCIHRIGYRRDIDGLRAVAIIPVVLFHAFPGLISGGFTGVDIFFVISGYLISYNILRDLRQDEFSFYAFYASRIKRIFPALIAMLIVAYVVGWYVLLPDEFMQLGKHMAASSAFVQNLALIYESGYFDTATELKPLMHLWSLAIEEQFYLIFPCLVLLVFRYKINLRICILVSITLSFTYNVIWSDIGSSSTFFELRARIWQLLVGTSLALFFINRIEPSNTLDSNHSAQFTKSFFLTKFMTVYSRSMLCNVLSLCGFSLILIAFFWINKSDSYPGFLSVLPVAGATLIIFFGQNTWLNRYLLSSRAMVFFGVISYPLYLWHWPILSFTHIILGSAPSVTIRLVSSVASVIVAWATYKIVETPIRNGGISPSKIFLIALPVLLIGCIGFYTHSQHGFTFRVKQFAEISAAAGEWDYPGKLERKELNGIKYFSSNPHGAKLTLFIGDSNIEQYYPRVDDLLNSLPQQTNGVLFKTGGGCFPLPDLQFDSHHKHCETLAIDAIALTLAIQNIENVVIGAQWNGYFSGGYGLRERIEVGTVSYFEALSKLAAYIKTFKDQNKNVFFILNAPSGPELDPKYIAQRSLANFPSVFQLKKGGISKTVLDEKFGVIQAALARVARHSGAVVIDPKDYLCHNLLCESLDANGDPMYKDSNHLRPNFVRKQIKFIDLTVQ